MAIPTRTRIMTTSPTPQALLQLMTWLSPAFPVGGFSYSHGLEAAIANGLVNTREELKGWLDSLITGGSLWNDCVLLAVTCRAKNRTAVLKVAELAEALAGSRERHIETVAQGKAFTAAAQEWLTLETGNETLPLPVALGEAARQNSIDAETAIAAFLQAFVGNQIQAALRLMPLGQTNGVWVQHQLEPQILAAARRAGNAELDDLGGNTFLAEIAAIQHETLQPRIFRT